MTTNVVETFASFKSRKASFEIQTANRDEMVAFAMSVKGMLIETVKLAACDDVDMNQGVIVRFDDIAGEHRVQWENATGPCHENLFRLAWDAVKDPSFNLDFRSYPADGALWTPAAMAERDMLSTATPKRAAAVKWRARASKIALRLKHARRRAAEL